MRNITVSIDEETYRRARIWAAERGTSVSAMVKCILVTLPARAPAKKTRRATQPTPHPSHRFFARRQGEERHSDPLLGSHRPRRRPQPPRIQPHHR
jgi:hypothetical protein